MGQSFITLNSYAVVMEERGLGDIYGGNVLELFQLEISDFLHQPASLQILTERAFMTRHVRQLVCNLITIRI